MLAVEWFREVADQGNMIAQFETGVRYQLGSDGVERNLEEARQWYEKSA